MKLSPRQIDILVEALAVIGTIAFFWFVLWIFAKAVMRYA